MTEKLLSFAKQIKIYHRCTPTNVEEQRVAFFAGKEPQFTYAPLDFDATEVREQLTALIFKGPLASLLERLRESLLVQLRILEHRGEREVVLAASGELYGRPDEELVATAKEFLAEPARKLRKAVPASRVKDALEKALEEYGLDDWRVAYAPKLATTVAPANRLITLNEKRLFTEGDEKRLVVHEVAIHALRAANGHAQPYPILSYGLPGYMITEEGLAAYAEEVTKTATSEGRRGMAGHVLAADAIWKGSSFRETFDLLREHFDEAEAWRITLRSYRAGGFVKDHTYLSGLLSIRRFVADGGDLRDLFIGKIGIGDLPDITPLVARGVLKPARYFPDFLSTRTVGACRDPGQNRQLGEHAHDVNDRDVLPGGPA